jgi:hypothetical protein
VENQLGRRGWRPGCRWKCGIRDSHVSGWPIVATPLGDATINLWSRSGRLEVDQILLTPDANFSPVGRLQETRSLASSYPAASTSVVVTSGFQPQIPIPTGSQLPIATVDEGRMFFGQSKLFPVVNNDFDPDVQTVTLVSAVLSAVRDPSGNLDLLSSTQYPVASVESGQVRVSGGSFPVAEVSYVIQDSSGNQTTGRLIVYVNPLPGSPSILPFNAGTQVSSPAAKFVTREETDITLPSAVFGDN